MIRVYIYAYYVYMFNVYVYISWNFNHFMCHQVLVMVIFVNLTQPRIISESHREIV